MYNAERVAKAQFKNTHLHMEYANMLLDLEDPQKCISLLASTADLTQDFNSVENVTASSIEAFKSRSPPSMVSSSLHSTQTLKTLMRPSTYLSRLLLALPRQYYLLTRISSAFFKRRSQFNSDGTNCNWLWSYLGL